MFTHEDAPGEKRWFGSVARLAAERGVEVVTSRGCEPARSGSSEWRRSRRDYLFSFYYRSMLPEPLLRTARWGALNMHGSLLPKYRGRAPVNWAILNGESSTGATLHYMVSKPDAGPIVAQRAVPIGIERYRAHGVARGGRAAADLLAHTLPLLAAGPPPARPMDLAAGSYFGGRKPEDGRIDWSWPAMRVHALIRAVAPPFPGASPTSAGSVSCSRRRAGRASAPRIPTRRRACTASATSTCISIAQMA